jgi:predicted ATPase
MLIERTEGNPLFLEESVRTLAETKALVGERGAYHLLLDAETIQIPSTVQALLAARIDRLAPEDKELLQAASVIGKDVPSALLHAITGWPDETLHGAIARLQAAELLYETRLFPDLEYTFKHTLTQEVAYRSLLQHRRRALHTQILEAIEALFADRLPEQTERLAHHAYRGEMWDKAVSYYRQAGSKALERSAYREAVVCFEHALSALARLPDSRATTEAAIDLRLDTVLAHFPLADAEQPRTYMSEAETLARDLDDQFRLFRVYTAQTLLALWEADYDQAIAAGQRAAAIADRLGDLGPQITASVQLGAAYLGSGQHQQASALHTDTIAALQGELLYTRFGFGTGTSSVVPTRAERPGLAWVHSLAAMSQAECGHLVAAGSLAAEAWRIAEQVDRPVDIVVAGLSMGWVSLHTGDVAANIPLLDHCRVMCRDLGLLRYAPFINAVLGYSLAYDERFSDALPLLMEAVEQAASRAILFYHARWVLWTGETQLRLGHVDDALRLARQALELSRTRKERGTEAWALRLLGEIAGHAPSAALDEADRYYQQALTLAGNLGMRPLVAHCHVGLASLSWRAGKSEEARAELGTAMTMFHETGMGPWRQKAEAAMRRLASSA